MGEKEKDALVTEASTNGDVSAKEGNVLEGAQVTRSLTNGEAQTKENNSSKDAQVHEASANGDVPAKEDSGPKALEHIQENGKKEAAEGMLMESEKVPKEDYKEEKGMENAEKEIGADEANNQVNNEGIQKSKEEVAEKKEPKKQGRRAKKTTEETEEKEDAKDAKKGSEVSVGKKRKVPSTPTPATIERPTRERKSVERFVISSEKDLNKEFLIEKGRGTRLKDIPNAAYHLSKRKSDDILKVLHVIIFGRRGKTPHIKNNISQFSGFVWGDNEEKQRSKVREKLDKCVKTRLLEFCELFDLPILKATDRKEELVAKLLDFLEAPHATRDALLSEQEQSSKKRKRVVKSASGKSPNSSAKGSTKRQKKVGDTPKSHGRKSTFKAVTDDAENQKEEEEKEKSIEGSDEGSEADDSDESDAEAEGKSNKDVKKEKAFKKSSKEVSAQKVKPKKVVDSDASDEESLEGSAEEDVKKRKSSKKSSEKFSAQKTAPKKAATSKKATTQSKSVKSPPKSPLKRVKAEERPESNAKVFSRKKKSDDKQRSDDKRKSSTPDKPVSRGKDKKVAKGKDEPRKKGKDGPTVKDLRKAICDILKEVDFNTATFTDILKQLAANFKTDLMPRKAEIKGMIQDELTKLADEADDEEEDGDGDDGEEGHDKQKEEKEDA